MKTAQNGQQITLYFAGRIDSSNAAETDAEAMEALNGAPDSAVIIDADDLEYISSAGLRVLLKIAKLRPGLKIVNASREVYEVFEMTGFTNIIPVERALRRFSVDGCPVIGQGAVGTLYQYDADTIVKVYRESTALEELEKEREYSRIAFVHGVPTRISFDIVRVGNCYGMIYEMINSSSMGRLISNDPERVEELAEKFAAVGKQIHAVDAAGLGIASAKETYLKAAKNLSPNYTEAENRTIRAWIEAMPEATCLVHGDFHPKNIMIQDGEPLLIDMGDICIGHPLYDYGTASFVIRWLAPEIAEKRSGVPRSHAERFWNTFLRANFGDVSQEKLAELDHAIECAALLRAVVVHGISNSFPQDAIDAGVAVVRESIMPRSEEILETLHGAQTLFAEFLP